MRRSSSQLMLGGFSHSKQSDDALVARAQAGDRAAIDALVRRHIVRVRMIARALLQNRADADDLVQDTFVRAFDRLDTLDVSRGGFGPWITRIATNAGLNMLKSRRVRLAEPVHLVAGIVSQDPRPDEAAEREEFRRRFRQALAGLSARQRTIVMLYEVDGLSTADIAAQLAMRPQTVRWHLHKARAVLRDALSAFRRSADASEVVILAGAPSPVILASAPSPVILASAPSPVILASAASRESAVNS
jgi:RNA polymerase sigma-70 factor (ECF subfamily)